MRNYDDWITGYLGYTKASEAPLQFHFWTAIATLAGALRGKVWRDEKTFRWTPNMYIVLVGPPGIAQKSTSMKLGMSLLEEVEGIHFGPSSATWQSLGMEMMKAGEEIKYTDPEAPHLGEQSFNLSCITLAISELGTFLKIAAEGFTDVLIDMWDGQVQKRDWTHSTVSSSQISVANPWLNMIACTTPAWLRTNFPESMIGGGLTSRILFIFGDKKRELIPYPSQHYRGNEFLTTRNRLIEDLQKIADMKGPFELTGAAIKYGTDWYRKLWTYRPPHLASDRFDSYISRKQVFLHKLAMIHAAATGSKLVMDKPHLVWANALLVSAEKYMGRVFQSIGVADQAVHVQAIARILRAYKRLTVNDLYHFLHQNLALRDFEEALKAGFHAGVFRQFKATTGGKESTFLSLVEEPKDEEEDD